MLLSAEELQIHIRGCSQNNRESQKKIYSSFYGYAMSICHRYTSREEDATEILNDGFLKVFVEIYRFKPAYADTVSSFKGWLRKIMIYTAIDHFRKNHKHQVVGELNESYMHVPATHEDAVDKISYEEILSAIKFLTPSWTRCSPRIPTPASRSNHSPRPALSYWPARSPAARVPTM